VLESKLRRGRRHTGTRKESREEEQKATQQLGERGEGKDYSLPLVWEKGKRNSTQKRSKSRLEVEKHAAMNKKPVKGHPLVPLK